MKNKFILALLVGVIITSGFIYNNSKSPDMFKVIKVTGTILYKKNNKNLTQGDLFPETEQIVFKTPDSKAAIVSTAKGRFILAPGAEKKFDVKANLLPASNNVGSRSGALINAMDIKKFFSGNVVLLEALKVQINLKTWPSNDTNFFFVAYKYKGETINKKLSVDNSALIFDKNEIYKVDGKTIDKADTPDMFLMYINKEKKAEVVGSFKMIVFNKEEFNKEIGILLKEIELKSKQEKLDEVGGYVQDFYGKIPRGVLEEYLTKEFSL